MCKDSINAAYAAILLNADMVNREPSGQKQAGICQKNRETGRFLSSKTIVKYNLKFFVNAGTVHFAGGLVVETLWHVKNSRYISVC